MYIISTFSCNHSPNISLQKTITILQQTVRFILYRNNPGAFSLSPLRPPFPFSPPEIAADESSRHGKKVTWTAAKRLGDFVHPIFSLSSNESAIDGRGILSDIHFYAATTARDKSINVVLVLMTDSGGSRKIIWRGASIGNLGIFLEYVRERERVL